MKGIVFAGGSDPRLYPLTKVTSKYLLPVFDKPMIYYPNSVLMLAGIKDILVFVTPNDGPQLKALLGDGGQFGIDLSYRITDRRESPEEALLHSPEFLNGGTGTIIHGDSFFYGSGFRRLLRSAVKNAENGTTTAFGYYVNDPARFDTVAFNEEGRVVGIQGKSIYPKSNYVVTDLRVFPSAGKREAPVQLSARGGFPVSLSPE